MTVLNIQVSAGADDGEVGFGNWYAVGTQIALYGNDGNQSGCRFVGIPDLSQAEIHNSYIEVWCSGRNGGPFSLGCLIEDSKSPAQVTDRNDFLFGRSWVGLDDAANAHTHDINEWNVVASLTEAIADLVETHNGITALMWRSYCNATNSGQSYAFRSYEFDTDLAPRLVIDYTPGNTAPTITVAPSVNYNGFTRTGPNNTPISVSFTATDPEETGANALNYQIRTAAGTGGTLVASGTFTSGVGASVNIAHNASGLSEGSNTLYLRVDDGTDVASTNPSFTLLVDRGAPTVGTITHMPNPVVS